MFKKKQNNVNDNCDYKPSLTMPFFVSYEDENPKKMKAIRKEIQKQEKKILVILQIYLLFLKKIEEKVYKNFHVVAQCHVLNLRMI